MEDVLYIIMRNDLGSLNPGKAMAQASHAYGALKVRVRSHIPMQKRYVEWAIQTPQDFGTTIVLASGERGISEALAKIEKFGGDHVIGGWVHDPTYPIDDGLATHLIPLDTCAFVFGSKEDCKYVVGDFPGGHRLLFHGSGDVGDDVVPVVDDACYLFDVRYGAGGGLLNALDHALRKALGHFYPQLKD